MNDKLQDKQLRQLKQLLETRYESLWKEIGAELGESARERFLQVAGEA